MRESVRPLRSLRDHPRAELVPAMTRDEYEQLRADIGRRGIQVALDITAKGVVLDGRHRLRIARELGLRDLPVRLVEDRNEVAYMLLAALNRRHLTASQKAAL